MNLPSEPPSDPAPKRLVARPLERPQTEFGVRVPVGILPFDRTEPSKVAVTGLWAYSNGFEPWTSAGGTGSSHRGDSRWWTWPLPPSGRMDFICLLGAAETRVSMDAQLILDAARQSVQAWPGA